MFDCLCACVCLDNVYFSLFSFFYKHIVLMTIILFVLYCYRWPAYGHFALLQLPGFVKLIMLVLHVLFAVAEINILLLLLGSTTTTTTTTTSFDEHDFLLVFHKLFAYFYDPISGLAHCSCSKIITQLYTTPSLSIIRSAFCSFCTMFGVP